MKNELNPSSIIVADTQIYIKEGDFYTYFVNDAKTGILISFIIDSNRIKINQVRNKTCYSEFYGTDEIIVSPIDYSKFKTYNLKNKKNRDSEVESALFTGEFKPLSQHLVFLEGDTLYTDNYNLLFTEEPILKVFEQKHEVYFIKYKLPVVKVDPHRIFFKTIQLIDLSPVKSKEFSNYIYKVIKDDESFMGEVVNHFSKTFFNDEFKKACKTGALLNSLKLPNEEFIEYINDYIGKQNSSRNLLLNLPGETNGPDESSDYQLFLSMDDVEEELVISTKLYDRNKTFSDRLRTIKTSSLSIDFLKKRIRKIWNHFYEKKDRIVDLKEILHIIAFYDLTSEKEIRKICKVKNASLNYFWS